MKSPKRSRSPRRKSKNRKYVKSPTLIDTSSLQKYSLGKFGYSSSIKTASKRRESLKKAIDVYGPHSVWNKLNVVAILNKNRSPITSHVFTMDKNWIKKNYI